MRSIRPPPVDFPSYRHRFMAKHAAQEVPIPTDAAVEDDGSKEAEVEEKAEEMRE